MKWHGLFLLVIGFLIAYYWPTVGDMTIGKLIPKS
jgi:hypothetical protein